MSNKELENKAVTELTNLINDYESYFQASKLFINQICFLIDSDPVTVEKIKKDYNKYFSKFYSKLEKLNNKEIQFQFI